MNLDKIRAHLNRAAEEFNGLVAQIGIPEGKAYPDGEPVAQVAAIHEFGAPAMKIPPRPFFAPTIEAKKEYWIKVIKQQAPKVLDGNLTAFDVLSGVGAVAALDIQSTIASIYSPALSPVTVMLRKWKKEGKGQRSVAEAVSALKHGEDPGTDNKPLNDTGLLIASIQSSVVKK